LTDDLIRGRYQALESAGRGGQGEVIRMIDLVHQRQLALKVRRLTSDTDREELLSEARILLDMRPHPNLPLVREDFVEGDLYFLAMDWVEGRSLRQVLQDEGGPGLPLDRVVNYLGQAAEAIDHLHDHDPPIVHLDVKPANLILTADGRVVLVDFGISTRWDGIGERRHGTPDFAAPEISTGEATPASDIYGLAATAYTLLTGAPPRPEVKPHVPGMSEQEASRLLQAIRRGLATNPRFRPASGAALVEAMGAGRSSTTPRHPPRRRHTRRLAAALAVAVATLSGGTWLATRRAPKTELAVLHIGARPGTMALNPQTRRLYLAETQSASLSITDDTTNEKLPPLELASTALALGVDPTVNRVYVGDANRGLSVIDGATLQLFGRVPLGSRPVALAVNQATNQVYVAGEDPNSLLVFDGATRTLLPPVPLGSNPVALAVNQATNQVYVAGRDPNSLVVFDGATRALHPAVSLTAPPCGVTVSPSLLNYIYVATDPGGVDVFQGATAGFGGVAFLVAIPVPRGSCAIALNPVSNRAYVAGGGPAKLTVIDVVRNERTRSRSLSAGRRSGVSGIAVDPTAGRLYVAEREAATLTVLNEKRL
jgi:serine/threonine protein kinase